MNKKTLLFTSLSVTALGLTSCNKWSNISNEKAIELGAKIGAAYSEFINKENAFNTFEIKRTLTQTDDVGKSTFTLKYIETYYGDVNNNYLKYTNQIGSDSNTGSTTFETTTYWVFENDTKYECYNYNYSLEKTSMNETEYKKKLYYRGLDEYIGGTLKVKTYIDRLDELIEEFENDKKTFEGYGNSSYSYGFTSKDDNSLTYNAEGKTTNMSNMSERFKQKYKSVSYHAKKEEAKVENNIVTYYHDLIETKGTDFKDRQIHKLDEETVEVVLNGNISRDTVKISDYTEQ